MVAYSFKPGFLPAISQMEKRQTIRLPRKRHARIGEALQLFTGPRMRPVRIGAATCVAVHEVRLDFDLDVVELGDAIAFTGQEALNAFAIRDGFRPNARLAPTLEPWEYLKRWWALTHPDQPVFRGILIDWDGTFAPAAP